jgi:pimeloyl-ACP methyl ester carboxylesterase
LRRAAQSAACGYGSSTSMMYHPGPDEFLATVVSESLKVPARVWRDYWEGVVLAPDHAARFGEIDAPTLILWGSRTSSSREKTKSGSRQRSLVRR